MAFRKIVNGDRSSRIFLEDSVLQISSSINQINTSLDQPISPERGVYSLSYESAFRRFFPNNVVQNQDIDENVVTAGEDEKLYRFPASKLSGPFNTPQPSAIDKDNLFAINFLNGSNRWDTMARPRKLLVTNLSSGEQSLTSSLPDDGRSNLYQSMSVMLDEKDIVIYPHDTDFFNQPQAKLIVSRDLGESWSVVVSPIMARVNHIFVVKMPKNRKKRLVATSASSIYFSDNMGSTWTFASGASGEFRQIIQLESGRLVILGGGPGTAFSDNYGESWTVPSSLPWPDLGDNKVMSAAIEPATDRATTSTSGYIVAARDAGFSSSSDALYVTQDGNSWTELDIDFLYGNVEHLYITEKDSIVLLPLGTNGQWYYGPPKVLRLIGPGPYTSPLTSNNLPSGFWLPDPATLIVKRPVGTK